MFVSVKSLQTACDTNELTDLACLGNLGPIVLCCEIVLYTVETLAGFLASALPVSGNALLLERHVLTKNIFRDCQIFPEK